MYRTTTDVAQRKSIYHNIDSISGVAAKYAIANEYDKMLAAIGANGTNAFTSVSDFSSKVIGEPIISSNFFNSVSLICSKDDAKLS